MTLLKKTALSLSIAVFATTVFADSGAQGGSTSGGDDDNTVAIVGGLAILGGLGYLYTTGAFSGGFAGATAGTAATTPAAKVGKTAVKAAQQSRRSVKRSVKRNANTHSHPAVPGVTKSMAHTHMGPMPHTHRYGR